MRRLICTAIAWVIAGTLGVAQKPPRVPPPVVRRVPPAVRKGQAKRPPGYFKRLRELSPKQQERVMANSPAFQRLPPAQQERIRENLRRWNALTPQQKAVFRQREEIFESLSPDQRQQLRAIFPEWRRLPEDRRRALMQAFRRLRDMPAGERQGFLASRELEQRFSPEERGILERLSTLLPAESRPASRDGDDE